MKFVFICGIVTILECALAKHQFGSTPGPRYLPLFRGTPAPRNRYIPPTYGVSEDYDDHEPANYEFEYRVNDIDSGNDFGHREHRQGDITEGSYQVLLPDGRMQIVDYMVDQSGYRPVVRYEGQAGPYNYERPSSRY